MPFGHYVLAFQIAGSETETDASALTHCGLRSLLGTIGTGLSRSPSRRRLVPPLEGEFGAGEVASATSAALCNNFRIVCPAASR